MPSVHSGGAELLAAVTSRLALLVPLLGYMVNATGHLVPLFTNRNPCCFGDLPQGNLSHSSLNCGRKGWHFTDTASR